jgi:Phage integrase, N-terminal SAM-like domain
MRVGEPGRVAEFRSGLRWRVLFPVEEHAAASSFLRDLVASDCSPGTLRSYAFDLLRWFRFLHRRMTPWERAERLDVREFVEWLRETPNPQRLRSHADAPPGSVNLLTGKAAPNVRYAARTINHQLSVLFGFYEWACALPDGPFANPVPSQRGRGQDRSRLHAHHNPMEDFVVHRRATYRQVPRPAWRAIPDDAAEALFAALRSHRDRALVSFWLSSGVAPLSCSGRGTATWMPAHTRSRW